MERVGWQVWGGQLEIKVKVNMVAELRLRLQEVAGPRELIQVFLISKGMEEVVEGWREELQREAQLPGAL